jgi:L-cysteate sulfo-lyase
VPLSHIPRAKLAHMPTPLEHMPNLTALLGGPDLYVKRDDCTGLAMGGNKARQLEFYFGEALRQGADTAIITGAVQSNFVRQAAAAANKLGMACEIQLEHRVSGVDEDYDNSGNVLLSRILGAAIRTYPHGEDEAGADAALEDIADEVRRKGGKPYVIHLGADHPPLGALGYVDAAFEFLDQIAEQDLKVDAVFLGSGSAATHAGFLTGLRYRNSPIEVVGICVRRTKDLQAPRVLKRAQETEELAGFPAAVTEDDIIAIDDYLGPGYGQSSPEMLEAIGLAAKYEGLILDPVYTGKTMAGMIDKVRNASYNAGQNIVFLHSGGTPAVFGHRSLFSGL